jgi:diguanylate cyclase (GGDEF)-like protein
MYLAGAAGLSLVLVLPGPGRLDTPVLWAICGGAAAWGALSLVVPWRSAPPWLIHVSGISGFVVVGIAVWAGGGASAPSRFFLFFIVAFGAYFFSLRVATLYLLGCCAVHALPLTYDGSAVSAGFLRELAVIVPAYLVPGAGIIAGKALLTGLREDTERARARERRAGAAQVALRRVATAVAAGAPAERLYELVSRELAELVNASGTGVVRYDSATEATVLGSYARRRGGRYEPGTKLPIRPGSELERALVESRTVSAPGLPAGAPVLERLGYRTTILAPIHVHGRVWGALAAAGEGPETMALESERRVTEFADLVSLAVANAEDRAQLAAQALTDPLTGLLNHRAFHERVAQDVSRARRHDRPLSLAMIDVDHFKEINDSAGHAAGDRILVELADRARGIARTEDVLGRVGGDEIAWLLTESKALQALSAVERLRESVRAEPIVERHVTISAGICGLQDAQEAERLFELADGALYWSKAHGRDVCWIYDPDVVQELSADERADHLERSHALSALRALARAIDAKDPLTRRHSDRVAELAARLAVASGWSAERVQKLREAALIHDVGKIGVSDAVLLHSGPLDEGERRQVQQHAALSAQIAEEALSPEQVSWIACHHERPDATGYPQGLRGEEIPEGAALLAMADAWDVMTISRPYSAPKSPEEALAECLAAEGTQFTEEACAALLSLSREDALTATAAELL